MKDVLQAYLKRLTNLSGNNKSLLQLRLYASQDFDVHGLDFLLSESSFQIIDSIIKRKKRIPLCDIQDPRNARVNDASRRLKTLKRREQLIYDERGARDLYLGWPFVNGQFSGGTPVRCPLLFFPVSLVQEEEQWVMKLRTEVNVTFNKSFLLAYGFFNQVTIPDDLLDTSFDDFETDSQVFRSSLYSFLKDSSLVLNFNQELFANELKAFTDFKRQDFLHQHGAGELKLEPQAVLGIYPQAGSYLVPDYHYLLDHTTFPDLSDFFTSRIHHTLAREGRDQEVPDNFIGAVREEHTFTPFKADASQENAIKAVKKGYSLVVQGPPGTGKSQLISNMIADFIARGKRVLLVSQKRAALDVVYERLREMEIDSFVGLVHDFKNDRKALYEQVARQIHRVQEYESHNNALDTIHLERTHLQASRKIDQITEELEEFRSALFDTGECGLSVKELYLTSDPEKEHLNVRQEYSHFTLEVLNEFVDKVKAYMPYFTELELHSHLWSDRKSFKGYQLHDMEAMRDVLNAIGPYNESFAEKQAGLIGHGFDIEEGNWILDREELLHDLLTILKPKKVFHYFKFILKRSTDKDWFFIREKRVMESFQELGVEVTLPTEELGGFQVAVEKCIKARKNIFKWVAWSLFNKDKYKIKRVVVGNGLPWSKRGFRQLRKKLDNRFNLEHNLTALADKEWIIDVPRSTDRQQLQKWFHNYSVALEARDISEELRSFRDYLKIDFSTFKELKDRLSQVIEICKEGRDERIGWQKYLTERQIGAMIKDESLAPQLIKSLERDFDALCEFDKVKASLHTLEEEVLKKAIDEFEKPTTANVLELIQNSLRLAWIGHIETKYPILRSVGSHKMEQMEYELRQQIQEKMQVSQQILVMKAREETYRDLEYNRLRNLVTYRDLDHQVTKKRKIWPLRKVVHQYHEELFKLVPCWMASPESVSAVFPMEELFDLVIFDEASQCFVEKGLPSIFRGRQLVITGDSKQLPPNDLYQVRWEGEEEEDLPELEIDSLLDLSARYLMEMQLQGHYRSKRLDLIDFSNQHFYNNSLRLLPDFQDLNKKEPGIQYEKVEGVWGNNSNEVEAERVVTLTIALLESGQSSLGIVTFNNKQQHLIQDKLESYCIEHEVLLPESVFIKNIENVQGDERDIILFSVGYAPNIQGKVHSHFGSLNLEKGENRLNVAVTRARERVILVTSIMPQQLNVNETAHVGPKLLKKYLEYAWEISNGQYKPSYHLSGGFNRSWYLKYALKAIAEQEQSSLVVKEELPFADLTVRKNEEYGGLVLTDDDLYFQSVSVKDMHGYVPMGLKGKSWKFQRFFSRSFWKDRTKSTNDFQLFLGQSAEKAETKGDS